MTSPATPAPASPPSSAPKTTAWFTSRVLRPRLLAAYIWSTLLTSLAGIVTLALLGAKDGFFGVVLCLAPYRLLFWTALGVSLSSYISYVSLSRAVTPRVHSSRVGFLLTLLRPTIFGAVLVQALLGGAIVKSLVGVAAPAFDSLSFVSLIVDEDGSQRTTYTMHEGAVFIATAGFFTAAKMGFGEVIRENSPLPSANALQMGKMIRMGKTLFPTLKASTFEAFASLKWFFLSYFLVGDLVKESLLCPWLAPGQECPQRSPVQVPMNSFLGFAEVGVLWKTFVAVTFLIFARKYVERIVTAYLSEPLSFSLSASALSADDGHPTLTSTLKPVAGDSVPPLAKFLAFQHLHTVVQDSASARKPFFSLSQPGGHPHLWNAVSSACSSQLISVFTAVVECNTAAAANNAKSAPSTSSIMRLSPIRFMFQEFPGSKARKVFVESSQSIYALSSLSHLVAASFKEDDFGVVQKKLAQTLDLLVNLYDAVEKNIKLYPSNSGTLNVKGFSSGRDDDVDILASGRLALRDAAKSALYRVIATFGTHIFGIQGLTTETSKRLKNFADIKE